MPVDWWLASSCLSGPYPSVDVPSWPWRCGVVSRRQEVDWVAQYRVLVGLEYPPDRRVEAGTVVDDIPGKSVKWLLDQGLIEAAKGSEPAKAEPVKAAKQDAKPAATPVEDKGVED